MKFFLRLIHFGLGIILMISVAHADRQMIRASSGIKVHLQTPEELRNHIFVRGANLIHIEASFRYLRDLDQWPTGYRELVEDFALHPEKAKAHDFSSRDWAAAVEALQAQKKRRGESISAEFARKISVQKIFKDIIDQDEYPSTVSLVKLDEALKSDPLLEQSLATNLEGPISAAQRRRLAPHIKKQVVASLSDITNISYQSAGEIGNLIRRFDLKGDDIDRLFAEAIQTSYIAAEALLIEALRPKNNGAPSEILLSKRFQKELSLTNVGTNRIFDRWTSDVKSGGEVLVRHIAGLPGWSENKDLHRFVAKLAAGADLATFRESVRVLDGTGERFDAALYSPENVDWLFDNRPDLVDSMFPSFKFLRAKAAWQIDVDRFEKVLNQQLSLDSREVLIVSRYIEELSKSRNLLPEQLNSWKRFIENRLKGDSVSPAARRALVESVRRLKIWSPEIEKSLVSWVANGRFNIEHPTSNHPMIAARSAINALIEAQARRLLLKESEELMVSGIKPPIHESTKKSAFTERRRPFSEVFYSSPNEKWNLIDPWLDLVKGMQSSTAVETELRKILEAFLWTQNPLPKNPGANLESPFLFDESTIRKVFAIIEARPVISEPFRAYLKDLLGNPTMRRAFYEYGPGLISKYNLPISATMRTEIERLKSGREFHATDQLRFRRPGPAASLEDFFRMLAQSGGPEADVYEISAAVKRSEQVGPTQPGKVADVVLIPAAAKGKAVGTNLFPAKLAELESLNAIENWTNSILGESLFDRQQFSQDLTESEVAFARIEKFLADQGKSRGQVVEKLLQGEWPLTADVRESLANRFPSFVAELLPEEKASIVNGILMGEIPNQPLAKSLVAPLTHQLAAELPAKWTAKGQAAFKSPADFRIASAMLHSSSLDKSGSRFFELISKSDMSLGKVEFLRVRDVLQNRILNAEEQTRLRSGLSADIGAVLRRSDFLQGGPARAGLAISLLEMADADTPEIQAALAARKGAVSSLFYQTPRSIVPTPKIETGGLSSLKILLDGCAESYRELKRK